MGLKSTQDIIIVSAAAHVSLMLVRMVPVTKATILYDIGFRFHLTTYVVHNAITLLWLGLGFGSQYEDMKFSVMVAIYWGILLFIHFIFFLWSRKNSIKNLDKKDLFE